jgi:hypothetical protein
VAGMIRFSHILGLLLLLLLLLAPAADGANECARAAAIRHVLSCPCL